MPTIPIQVRLATNLVELIDQRASAASITRADVLRGLVEAAFAGPQALEHDPLLDQIADAVGTLLAKVDATLTASRNANANAEAAYANARLHARMALPTGQWQAFREELEKRS